MRASLLFFAFFAWESARASDSCDDQVSRQVRVDLKPMALVVINNTGGRNLAIDVQNVGSRDFNHQMSRDLGLWVEVNGVRYWATSYLPIRAASTGRLVVHARAPWSVDACQTGGVLLDPTRSFQYGCNCFGNDAARLRVTQVDGGGGLRRCFPADLEPAPIPHPPFPFPFP